MIDDDRPDLADELARAPEPPPVAADMREIFGALVGMGANEDGKSVEGRCCRCNQLIKIPGWIHDIVRGWNRRERRLVAETELHRFPHRAEYITLAQVIPCGPCEPILRLEIETRSIQDNQVTDIYLRELRRGTYTAESLEWLRQHGFAKEVVAQMTKGKEL